jgi:hypothetical protein
MRESLWPLLRGGGPQVQGLHFAYEKAGLLVRNEPIPWNADAVLVTAYVKFTNGLARRKTDFTLRLPGQPPAAPTTLHRHEDTSLFCLQFRLPPLARSTPVELQWRGASQSQLVLPLLSAEEFVQKIRVESPTVFAQLGDTSVACQTVVAKQCRGLVASALLTSPTSLTPLLDLDFVVEFAEEDAFHAALAPVHLTGTQLQAHQALVSVVAPHRPHRLGRWAVTWFLNGEGLARQELHVVGQRLFRKGLHVVDSRYVVQEKGGRAVLTRILPTLAPEARLGPCFLLASREPGMAARCEVELRIHSKTPGRTPQRFAHDVLISDGPCLFLPGTLEASELDDVSAFELVCRGQSLGFLSTRPAPSAQFTSEGGFRAQEEYAWSLSAEEELGDRLSKLMDLRGD